jgi:hypothetical protein
MRILSICIYRSHRCELILNFFLSKFPVELGPSVWSCDRHYAFLIHQYVNRELINALKVINCRLSGLWRGVKHGGELPRSEAFSEVSGDEGGGVEDCRALSCTLELGIIFLLLLERVEAMTDEISRVQGALMDF